MYCYRLNFQELVTSGSRYGYAQHHHVTIMKTKVKRYREPRERERERERDSKQVTLWSLCFLSSFSAKTVLASLDKVSLLMLLDWTLVESFKLG